MNILKILIFIIMLFTSLFLAIIQIANTKGILTFENGKAICEGEKLRKLWDLNYFEFKCNDGRTIKFIN